MEKIISLQNSGESLEKVIALMYTARKSCPQFYAANASLVFFGHNLPKKTKRIMPHGSVGFYEKYFSSFEFNPVKDDGVLIEEKHKILLKLFNKKLLTERNAEKLSTNDNLYIEFIKLMPMDVVFEEVSEFIFEMAESYFGNVFFQDIHLEDNYMKYYTSLEDGKWAYSIYSLDYTGTISKFYFPNLSLDDYSLRNLVHVFNELNKKSCLSGNSAMFLAAIKDMTRNMKYKVGYREHKRETRKTRNYALESILKEKNGIIEPKNTVFSGYFNQKDVLRLSSMEEKANEVIALAFRDFLNECMIW